MIELLINWYTGVSFVCVLAVLAMTYWFALDEKPLRPRAFFTLIAAAIFWPFIVPTYIIKAIVRDDWAIQTLREKR